MGGYTYIHRCSKPEHHPQWIVHRFLPVPATASVSVVPCTTVSQDERGQGRTEGKVPLGGQGGELIGIGRLKWTLDAIWPCLERDSRDSRLNTKSCRNGLMLVIARYLFDILKYFKDLLKQPGEPAMNKPPNQNRTQTGYWYVPPDSQPWIVNRHPAQLQKQTQHAKQDIPPIHSMGLPCMPTLTPQTTPTDWHMAHMECWVIWNI